MTSRLNKNEVNFKLFIVITLLIIGLMVGWLQIGRIIEREEIKSRVWPHQKDCYNEQDLEIIILGETQK